MTPPDETKARRDLDPVALEAAEVAIGDASRGHVEIRWDDAERFAAASINAYLAALDAVPADTPSEGAREAAIQQWHAASDHARDGVPLGGYLCNCERVVAKAESLGWLAARPAPAEDVAARVAAVYPDVLDRLTLIARDVHLYDLGEVAAITGPHARRIAAVILATRTLPETEEGARAIAVLGQVSRYLERFNPGGTHGQDAMAEALGNILAGAQVAWSPSDDRQLSDGEGQR